MVGVAGGADKCAYVVNALGFDACIDYKQHADAASLSAALHAVCSQGIEGYFENVGGMVMNAVLPLMNAFGRVAVCGMIAGYNGAPIPMAAPQLILMQRLRFQGFIVSEHPQVWPAALAELGGTEVGARMSGVTLSHEQLAFANQRMQKLGLESTSNLRLQDYRDIDDEPYDAICSIEMLEAVGQEYWDTYFQSVARLLKSGGKACVQTIVIDDALFDRYVKSTDFIQQYIFPGGCLPCPREFRAHAERAGLTVVDELAFGLDYAETLRRWRHAFLADQSRVLALGFDERFVRIWDFYLAYCEAAFEQHNTDVLQFTLVKP